MMASSGGKYNQNFSSDIFNQKDVPVKPVISEKKIYNQKESSDIFQQNMKGEDTNIRSKRTENKSSDIFNQNPKVVETQGGRGGKNANRLKSDIFFNNTGEKQKQGNEDQKKDNIIKIKKSINNDYDPTVYYKEETASARRQKELYGSTFVSKNSSSTKPQAIANEDNTLSAKERKIREYYTNTKEVELKTPDQLTYRNSRDCTYNQDKDAVYNKVEQLKSNIFNDPEKESINQRLSVNYKQKEKDETPATRTTLPSNPWQAKMDWKDPKTELLFKHNNDTAQAEVSALQRKMNDLRDSIGDQAYSQYKAPLKKDIIDEAEDVKEIHNTVKEALGEVNEAKIKKNMENMSAIQGKEFFEKNMKFKKTAESARPVQSFEIPNIPDFDNFQIKEIESLFKGKGIHIFDSKSSGLYINGNKNGTLTFKIRENADENFAKNMEEITTLLKNDKGLVIGPSKKNAKKKVENIPAQVQWNSTHLTDYARNRLSEPKGNLDSTGIAKSKGEVEKISKHVVNRQYKNNTTGSKGKK